MILGTDDYYFHRKCLQFNILNRDCVLCIRNWTSNATLLYRLGVAFGWSVAQPVSCQAVNRGEILCMSM